jgi:electron transfer flavoprotein alpha subunit
MSAARVLVLTEWLQGKPTGLTTELLGCARLFADEASGEVAAVLLASDGTAQELIAYGADEVFTVALPAGSEADVETRVAALATASVRFSPELVLIGHTALGADVAPRLAFRLETGVAMGCVEIARDGGKLMFTRPRQGGIAREVLSFMTAPAIATLRAGCHDAAIRDAQRSGRITTLTCDAVAVRTRVIERRRDPDEAGVRLEDARIVVAGGRGLNGPEGFRLLEALAQTLGAAVGASRVPCDLGWCPRSWQIGLTGKTVTPDLYLAVGISGAGHHIAGCGNAKAIVAVNTDAGAAIFKEARYGVVGDYQQVVPALIEAIRKLNA